MRSRSGILILVGVAIVVAILALVRGNGSQPSVDHQSNSDAADGTSALKAYASALGHPVTTLDSDFTLPHSDAIMFVFTPDQPFTIDEAQALSSWISRGGTLIYANESPDPALDPTLSLHRSDGETSLDALGTLAGLAGVQRVTGSTLGGSPLLPNPDQVVLLRSSSSNEALAIRAWQDRGQIFWLADPQELCNGSIGQGDNGRLAADLLGIAAKAPVVFDEFHHGGAATIGGSGSWTSLPWGIALIWASIVLLVGLAWRGRRFGPLLPRTVVGDRSTREYTRAVGDLLRRSGGRRLTLELLIRAAARRAAERSGLSLDPNSPEVGLLLASRNPLLSQAWSQAMVSAATATASDQALAETARHLHKLAYPEDDQTTNPSGVHPPPPIDEGDDQ